MPRIIHITFAALVVATSLVAGDGVAEARGALSSSRVEPEIVALKHLASTLASGSLDGRHTEFAGPSGAGLRVLSTATSDDAEVTHVYVQQTLAGIDIVGADANVAVREGEVAYAPSRLIPLDDAAGATAPLPALDSSEAATAAATALGLDPTTGFDPIGAPVGDDQAHALTSAGIANEPIGARLSWVWADKDLRLAWELTIDPVGTSDWWSIRIDAETGEEIDRFNHTITDHFAPVGGTTPTPAPSAPGSIGASRFEASARSVADGSSYDVFPMPVEAPSFATPAGRRTVVTEPADAQASPFGWHDTNGVVGPESTLTVGNNVIASTDVDNDDVPDPGSQPDGGPLLDFSAPLDLAQDPDTYADAAVINLFYWNNVVHDVLAAHGFDESSGNFQTNNYGRGGLGGDAVVAEALDSSALAPTALNRNNANFTALPDGIAPRMQMYRFTGPDPDRAASFDNGIVAHEYAHGLSIRLTGGASTASCLANGEQAGEGWSDFVALITTLEPGDAGTDSRGIGTYVTGQPPTGFGIRARPYSTDLTIDERTYADIATSTIPHGVGSVWAAMLWDVTWGLIDVHGFDPDLARGDGGNNLALRLVIAGLKLQPCSPGFVDARDAILQADELLNDGDNVCVIWAAFAKRGLGASASQGSPSSPTDGTEAFDMPTSCPLSVDKSADVQRVSAGDDITYTVDVVNRGTAASNGVVVTDPISLGSTYVAGSATCPASLDGRTLRLQFGTIAAGARRSCSFDVTVGDVAPVAEQLLFERFEPDASAWTLDHDDELADADWALSTDAAHSRSHSVFGADVATRSDQYLTLSEPIAIPRGASLSFWHRFDFEASNGQAWDGGVVEVSTDGGTTWDDLGASMAKNGYNSTISGAGGAGDNPLAGRPAFGGDSGGAFIETVAGLDDYVGEAITLRFRLGTDASVGGGGWFVDDITIETRSSVPNTATVSDADGHIDTSTVVVGVTDPLDPPTPDPTTQAWRPVTPTRVLDTRDPSVRGGARRSAGSTTRVIVSGRGGIPHDAEAVIINVTAVRAASSGFVTAYACGAPRPTASSLNFTTGVNLGNEIVAAVGTRGDVCLFSSAEIHLTVDAVGYAPRGSAVRPNTPIRLMDTRAAGTTIDQRFVGSGPLRAGTEVALDVVGRIGVPGDSETAIINVTAIRGAESGFVTVHPCQRRPPTASSLNFGRGINRANELVAELDDEGRVCFFVSADVELAVDLVATIPAGTDIDTVGPARLFDSRPAGSTIDGAFLGGGVVPAGTVTRLEIAGRAGVDRNALTAVLNLTAVQARSPGYVTVWPCSQPRPTASSLNYVAGVNGANEIIVGLDTDGRHAGHICLFNDQPIGMIVDVVAFTDPG